MNWIGLCCLTFVIERSNKCFEMGDFGNKRDEERLF